MHDQKSINFVLSEMILRVGFETQERSKSKNNQDYSHLRCKCLFITACIFILT